MSDNIIILNHLAEDIGMDRSHLRRFVLSLGLEPFKVRTKESRGQRTLAITAEEAELVREARQKYLHKEIVDPKNGSQGLFYVIQLVPDLDPNRIKLGYTEDMEQRLQAHHIAAPTAQLARAWPSKRIWEATIIDSVTRIECAALSHESFDCEDLATLLERCEAVFSILPSLEE